MRWLTKNLLLLMVCGSLFVAFSILHLGVSLPHGGYGWAAFGFGAACLILALIGLIAAIVGPPGQEETVAEEPSNYPDRAIPNSAIKRLRLSWNSEGSADWPVAETLAILSEMAYLPPVDAERAYRELGFPKFMPIVAGSMIGYVISGEDVTVIVFRGTDSADISDWIANLGRSATKTPNGSIHSGFYNAYYSMEPQIVRIIAERQINHLWITGHSLGGALALVCMYDLVESKSLKVDGIITFGQPLVAREGLAEHLDKLLLGKYVRFVNGRDVVARIPPSHAPCGSLVWFNEDGIRRSMPKQVAYNTSSAQELSGSQAIVWAEGTEVDPLSDDEFTELQIKLRATDVPVRHPDGTVAYGLSMPLIEDHAMTLYLEKIRGLLGLDSTE